MNKEYLSIEEAAEYTGLSKWTFYKLTSKKAIKHRKVGARCILKRSELDGWLDKFKVNTKEDADGCQKS